MTACYNDIDPFVCAWLQELMDAGLVTPGVVLCKDIQQLDPGELMQYTRVHLFAGIGGWELALQLAGWPKDWPVWAGSPPCQPFSTAGKKKGEEDERHLWPAFLQLIKECRPPVLFGEQVASPLGRLWLSRVQADLEDLGYAVGAADLPSCCVGAPHQRQRLFWVAYTHGNRFNREDLHVWQAKKMAPARCGSLDFWKNATWVQCTDGHQRRIPSEPALFPLADGVPNRVGLLRGAGNAIVPQVAAVFIQAFLAAIAEMEGNNE